MRSSTSSSDSIHNSTELPLTENHPEDAFQMPWAFLIALLIAVVIEWICYTNLDKTLEKKWFYAPGQVPGITHTIVEAKVDFIMHGKTKVDLLVMGDSSGLMGVDAKTLGKETGLKTYNLCTIGYLGVEGNRFLLEQYIEKHGVPSVVLFHTAPDTWGYTEKHFQDWGWRHLVKERFQNPHEKVKRRFKKLPSQNFRYLAQKAMLPESFSKRLLTKDRGKYRSHNDLLKYLADQKGSMDEIKFDKDIWTRIPKLERRISNVQLKELRELIKLSQQKGFLLCVVCNPLPEIAQTPHNKQVVKEIEQKVKEVCAEEQGDVHVRQPLVQYLPNKSLSTLNHLSPNTKPWYTKELARWINSKRR